MDRLNVDKKDALAPAGSEKEKVKVISLPEVMKTQLKEYDKANTAIQEKRNLLITGFLAGKDNIENTHCVISPDFNTLTLTDKEPKNA